MIVIRNYNVWGLDLSQSLQGAGGVGGLLAVISPLPLGEGQGEGSMALACYDANGNITEYLSESGTIAAHYEYSPFGEIAVQTGSLASTFTHRFSTKPWCAVTGFSEYEYRKYCPSLGRWLSRDPDNETGFAQILRSRIDQNLLRNSLSRFSHIFESSVEVRGWNIYSFVNNASFNHYDHLGLRSNPVFGLNGPVGYSYPPIIVPEPSVYPKDDCVCAKGSKEGRRQKDDRDPVKGTDQECTFVPDGVFTVACKKHDVCYATCNSSRLACDEAFYDDMWDDCSKACGTSMGCMLLCSYNIPIYYAGVRRLGDSPLAGDQSFSNLQAQACEKCCCR